MYKNSYLCKPLVKAWRKKKSYIITILW